MKKKGWLKILCNLDLFLASIALAVLTLVTFAAVIMRYVLKAPLLWQEEAQAFCQVWMIFLGASVAFRQGSIVAIEMVVDALPEKGKKIMEYVVDMIVIFTLTFLMVKCQADLRHFSLRLRTDDPQLPAVQVPAQVRQGYQH